ncbi:hypothetical protein KC19_7G047700 [Ceratodon purpureus]|uniref:Uncharacterized protein n=1 Tax=Ceratodon purpureus TaxID=3225 RepID=A0A8T0H7G6_CERPU|nr:hypothetical protein KC19_7G047700 [Ceratodon purpureus]
MFFTLVSARQLSWGFENESFCLQFGFCRPLLLLVHNLQLGLFYDSHQCKSRVLSSLNVAECFLWTSFAYFCVNLRQLAGLPCYTACTVGTFLSEYKLLSSNDWYLEELEVQ